MHAENDIGTIITPFKRVSDTLSVLYCVYN